MMNVLHSLSSRSTTKKVDESLRMERTEVVVVPDDCSYHSFLIPFSLFFSCFTLLLSLSLSLILLSLSKCLWWVYVGNMREMDWITWIGIKKTLKHDQVTHFHLPSSRKLSSCFFVCYYFVSECNGRKCSWNFPGYNVSVCYIYTYTYT